MIEEQVIQSESVTSTEQPVAETASQPTQPQAPNLDSVKTEYEAKLTAARKEAADLQEKFKSEIHEDHYLATLIKAEFDEYSGGTRLVAQDFLSLSGVRMKYLKELELEICDDMIEAENVKNTIQKLRRLLSSKK